MELRNNTILIIGDEFDFCLGLAKSLQSQGNTVILGHQDDDRLAAIKPAHPRLNVIRCNIWEPGDVSWVCDQLKFEYPRLNIFISVVDFLKRSSSHVDFPGEVPVSSQGEAFSLIPYITLADLLTPLLIKQPQSCMVNIIPDKTSVPKYRMKEYEETFAGYKALLGRLRRQMEISQVKVFEVTVPPFSPHVNDRYVKEIITALHKDRYIVEVGKSGLMASLKGMIPAPKKEKNP